jgi:hypothetical protein
MCKPMGPPMTVDAFSNCAEETPASNLPPGLVPYQSLIGSLLYASVSIRPDIAMAVTHISMYMSDPSQSHWEQAKRTLPYLGVDVWSCTLIKFDGMAGFRICK